ncbi:MAG: O-antigen ligase family protein [Planococcus citreus]
MLKIITCINLVEVFSKKGKIHLENTLHVKNQNYMIELLVICLVVAIAPVIVAGAIIPGLNDYGVYNLVVGVGFTIQVILLFVYFLFFTEKNIDKDFVFLLFFLIVSQSATIYSAILLPIDMDYIDVINAVGTVMSFIIFVCVPSELKITQKGLTNFFISIVILGVLSCLYNLVINFQGMINILEIESAYDVNFSSFYTNRNGFAQIIFFSIVANTYLLLVKKQKIYYLTFFFLGISLLLTISRGGIAATVIFGLVFMLFTMKKSLVRNLSLALISFPIFFLLWFNPTANNFISSMLIREETGTTGRFSFWLEGIKLLNQTNWFFGVGEFTSINYFRNLGYTVTELHSFYIETLVKGGLALFLFYIVIFVLMVNRYWILKRADREAGIIYISALVSLLVYCLIESVSFFTIGYVGSLFTIFFITVPLLYSNNFLK